MLILFGSGAGSELTQDAGSGFKQRQFGSTTLLAGPELTAESEYIGTLLCVDLD